MGGPVSVVPVKVDPVLVDLVLVVPDVTQARKFVVMKFLRLSALVSAILDETGSLRFDVISGLIEHKCVFCSLLVVNKIFHHLGA